MPLHLSHLAEEITAPPTLALNQRARELQAAGQPVIHLGSGEPSTPVPPEAVEACNRLLASGQIRYSNTRGIPPLVDAIRDYTERWYGRRPDSSQVIVCNGAKHAIYTLIMAIISPNEEVIIPAPYWVSYPELVRMAYGQPVIVAGNADTMCPVPDLIAAAVSERTRAIILNSPNNPSGAIIPVEEIRAILEMCRRHDLFLIMDDIYHRLVFDSASAPSVYGLFAEAIEDSRVIVINGVSKLYGMTGFRIGWAVGSSRIINAMLTIASQTLSCASILTQTGAYGAMTGNQSCVEALRLTLQENRNIILEALQRLPGLKIPKPSGTFYCLPDFSAYQSDSVALSEYLLKTALVVTVPGKEFGAEGHLRLSYCGTAEEIVEGVRRICWALDPTAEPETVIGHQRVRRM